MAKIFDLEIPPGLEDLFNAALTYKISGAINNLMRRKPSVSYKTARAIATRSLFVKWEPIWDTFLIGRRNAWQSYWSTLPFGSHSGANGWPGSGYSAFVYINAPRYAEGLALLLDPPFFDTVVTVSDNPTRVRSFVFNGSTFSLDTDTTLGSSVNAYIASLDGGDIAVINDGPDRLGYYHYSSAWTQVGNLLNISGGTNAFAIEALSNSLIAFYNTSDDTLRALNFDGINWSQVGSSLSLVGLGVGKIARLSYNRIAISFGASNTVRVYDFNGSNFVQVGTTLNFTLSVFWGICALSSTRIVIVNDTPNELSVFDFDGSTWSQVGSTYTFSNGGNVGICSLSNERIVLYSTSPSSRFRVFDFDGSTWSQVGGNYSPGIGNSAFIATLRAL